MNLQESIRKILREGQFDDEQISLKNKIIRHLNHMGYETNKNESDDEIINKLSSLKNDGDTQAGVFLRRITTKIKAKDVHAKAIGNGPSRKPLNLEHIKSIMTTYGCNALYRDFIPDYLISMIY